MGFVLIPRPKSSLNNAAIFTVFKKGVPDKAINIFQDKFTNGEPLLFYIDNQKEPVTESEGKFLVMVSKEFNAP